MSRGIPNNWQRRLYFRDKNRIKTPSSQINLWGKHEESSDCFQLKLLTPYSVPIILKLVFAKSFNIGQK